MMRPGTPPGRRRGARGQELHQGADQGHREGDVQDGDLDHPELLRGPDLRGDRPRARGSSSAYFTWTPSRIGGVGIDVLAEEALRRHRAAFASQADPSRRSTSGGQYQWRHDGERHLFNPETIHKLQTPAAPATTRIFKEYSRAGRRPEPAALTLRGLMDLKPAGPPVPIDEVEPVEAIMQALQDRRHVLRLDQPGGPRGAGHRHEPHRRQEQHRRGRRGPGTVRPGPERRLARTAPSSRWPPAASASPATTWSTPRRSRSRWPRAPSRAKAASCPARRSIPGSPRSATRRRASG